MMRHAKSKIGRMKGDKQIENEGRRSKGKYIAGGNGEGGILNSSSWCGVSALYF